MCLEFYNFFISFLIYGFIFKVSDHFLDVTDMTIETVNITQFIF